MRWTPYSSTPRPRSVGRDPGTGTYGSEGLSPGEREPLIGNLLDLYRNDPDAGIHGAAEWTLRQWKRQEKLKELDAQLMKVKDWGDRRWFVNSQGQNFAVIEGPVEFRMGRRRPSRIVFRRDPTRVQIPRRFAIAAKEVTVEQYQKFVKETPWTIMPRMIKYSPDPEGPINSVSWYHAAAYCNWLSRKENLPECYEPNERGKYAAGMRIKADALKRPGYRLPTEAEWEYACRSGAATSRYYGSSIDLLGRYARYSTTSPDPGLAVRQPAAQRPGLVRHAGQRVGVVSVTGNDRYGTARNVSNLSIIQVIRTY